MKQKMKKEKKISDQKVIDKVRDHEKNEIRVAVSNIDGILKGKLLSKEKLLASIDKGFGLSSVILGWDCHDHCCDHIEFTGPHTGYHDLSVKIDLDTYRTIPWNQGMPSFLGEFVDQSGKSVDICPRYLIKRTIHKAKEMGFILKIGYELEWYNFLDSQMKEYQFLNSGGANSILLINQNQTYINAIIEDLLAFDIPLEGFHPETGPGVYEAAIAHTHALEAADRAILFKTAIKEIGQKFGITPSFMAKFRSDLPGCGAHIHQSLWDLTETHNLFYSSNKSLNISSLLESYIAGQLHCLPEIFPFFAPTVNSYKRLIEGQWAPIKANWGIDNRLSALRIIPGDERSMRLESRAAGADANPYLAIAACIASGLYGIENNMKLSPKLMLGHKKYVDELAVNFPKNLFEATRMLADSKVAHDFFGRFVDHFIQTRLWEWKQFQENVTDWEIRRYLKII